MLTLRPETAPTSASPIELALNTFVVTEEKEKIGVAFNSPEFSFTNLYVPHP